MRFNTPSGILSRTKRLVRGAVKQNGVALEYASLVLRFGVPDGPKACVTGLFNRHGMFTRNFLSTFLLASTSPATIIASPQDQLGPSAVYGKPNRAARSLCEHFFALVHSAVEEGLVLGVEFAGDKADEVADLHRNFSRNMGLGVALLTTSAPRVHRSIARRLRSAAPA